MKNFDNLKVVLASASPRRKELLSLIFNEYDIRPADCDEALPEGIKAQEAVEYLSLIKNKATVEICDENSLVISADTVVAVEGEILGKPQDKEDARRMISLLSGREHQVFTGVTLSLKGNFKTFSEKTDVVFYKLTDKEIEDYISTDEPYDKAGAYGIQGKAGLLVKAVNGDYYNVVGLPVARLKREIMEFIENQ
ncbi:MAG: septum formation protein Maf [Clostridia bacterium]|nr:septum formation protein Maf [Clostridia bacterium]MBQ6837937.1 septum formation protein Maf [Clostridia bacterium]